MTPVVSLVRLRPPAFSGGKRGVLPSTGPSYGVRLQPASREALPDVSSQVLYNSFFGFTVSPAIPDIQTEDRLQDQSTTDPRTGTYPLYIVRGVKQWGTHHLELWLERAATA